MYEGLQDSSAYILKEGIIKTSVISSDGREFNFSYITGLEIVSLLRDEYSKLIDAPFNIRVESPTAVLHQLIVFSFGKISIIVLSYKIMSKNTIASICYNP